MNANANEQSKLNQAVAEENQESAGAAQPAETGKRKPDVAAEILQNADGKPYAVRMTFGGREDRRVEVGIHKLTAEVQLLAMLHGLKQKLGDAAAISRNPETGRSATTEDKFRAVEEVANRLLEGDWNKRREGSSGAGGLLMRALTRIYAGRMDVEQLKEWLDQKTDKEKAALRRNPKVIAEIEAIRAEEGSAGTGDDLLAELDQLNTNDSAE